MLFFLCKQKTAYEMRISDWSSDVCSSDLIESQWRYPHEVPFGDEQCLDERQIGDERLSRPGRRAQRKRRGLRQLVEPMNLRGPKYAAASRELFSGKG